MSAMFSESICSPFSAMKIGGQRAYKLARGGHDVQLEPRTVRVYGIELLDCAWPLVRVRIDCGRGTYIRSIARDVGEALGCGGLIEILTRTRIGPFTQEEAVDPMTLTRETIPGLLRPAAEAVAALPRVVIGPEDRERIGRGQAIVFPQVIDSGEVAIMSADGRLVAIGESRGAGGRIEPRRVLTGIP